MERISRSTKLFSSICCLTIGVGACSAMILKPYPEPSMNSFANSKTFNGVSAVAQPLLNEKKSNEYFGVNLLEKGILAIHLSVKNNNPNTSFTIPGESIFISQVETGDLKNSPEQAEQEAGEELGTLGAFVFLPLAAIGAQQSSDATIIKENFESKRFRTKTIDPDQIASGFSYFNWKNLTELDKATLCFKLIDPIADKSSTFCQDINLRR